MSDNDRRYDDDGRDNRAHGREQGSDPREAPGRSGPDLLAYTVRDRGEGEDSFWCRIGAAWKHKDGQGFDIALNANPVDGRLTLREQRREEFMNQRAGDDQKRSRDPKRDSGRSR